MDSNMPEQKNNLSYDYLMDSILAKYNLQEDPNVMFEKYKKGGKANKTIVTFLAEDLYDGKITEKDFSDSLVKSFSFPEETNKKIISDVKTTFFPFLKKADESRLENEKAEKIKLAEAKNIPLPSQKEEMPIADKPVKRTKKNIEELQIPNVPSKKIEPKRSGPDSYREPIE